jgi:hypothetical protein
VKYEHWFNIQLSTSNVNNECKQALSNKWFAFKVLGRGKKLNELFGLPLANDERFPILGKAVLHSVCVLPVPTVCCERGFSQMNLVKSNFRSSLQTKVVS